MTDAPKLPPFPELPVNTPHLASDLMLYYRDLAAAYEARCRLLYAEMIAIHGLNVDPYDVVARALRGCGPLPPKEG